MIISLDIDAQKTFTPLCPDELPVVDGHLIVDELNAQAKLAQFRVMSKDAHSPLARWLCANQDEQLQETGLPNARETWVSHAMVGSMGFELLDGLPAVTEYDYCVWKGVEVDMHPYGACFHDLQEKLSTGLIEWLKVKGATTLIVGGLATDYCVKKTVLQLLKNGDWQVIVNRAACRGIEHETVAMAWREMVEAGAIVLNNTAEIVEYLDSL
ncbi:isochorismatase family protein [Kingella negevensis]|uniref:nicotinamidase n=1 Tax=Kingella negevensis TaxID=1522312 RepID=A0A238HEV2_9NEIS|nr:isochorismatase family protein [Kingella negevensis]MDK4679263.1 isochorismatase family protein [Kingella negevensis]MDK4683015.1 isochorismatase family protein [Kingella negevensis]MDK4683792.1 isochorismatase family protein [Kingella negevensis]MDK4691215.1 isochorismatase family protein [Kingella negevensis]MDK4693637.1 isochorismatase family protein [Kingella negevensis]